MIKVYDYPLYCFVWYAQGISRWEDVLNILLLFSLSESLITSYCVLHITNQCLGCHVAFGHHTKKGEIRDTTGRAIVTTNKKQNWFHVVPLFPTVNEHYNDVIMDAIASQITSLTIVYSAVYSDADQRKHQSSTSLAFVWRIHRGPVNSPHKWSVTRKMFPFDNVFMIWNILPHWFAFVVPFITFLKGRIWSTFTVAQYKDLMFCSLLLLYAESCFGLQVPGIVDSLAWTILGNLTLCATINPGNMIDPLVSEKVTLSHKSLYSATVFR